MDFEYVSLYQRDMHNKCCNGKAWCVKVRLIFISCTSLQCCSRSVINQIKDICGIICAAMTWFLIFFAGICRQICKGDAVMKIMKTILFYRIRCDGGNITTESVSRIQSNQHCYFQYTVILGHILPFKDDVFGSGKLDDDRRCLS